MALIAKYIARHRLRETRLLDTIADFLVKKAEYLDSKVRTRQVVRWPSVPVDRTLQVCSLCPQVIQKLVFPFSRMSYRPSNEQQFFSRLEEVVELKALSSPLATVNILMSLFQLGHFPGLVLHRVFSSAFISNVTSQFQNTTNKTNSSPSDPDPGPVTHPCLHRQSLCSDRAAVPLSARRCRGAGVP